MRSREVSKRICIIFILILINVQRLYFFLREKKALYEAEAVLPIGTYTNINFTSMLIKICTLTCA